jgi:hypothetical protein
MTAVPHIKGIAKDDISGDSSLPPDRLRSIAADVAVAGYKTGKFVAQNVGFAVSGTPFNGALVVINKLFEICDVSRHA